MICINLYYTCFNKFTLRQTNSVNSQDKNLITSAPCSHELPMTLIGNFTTLMNNILTMGSKLDLHNS